MSKTLRKIHRRPSILSKSKAIGLVKAKRQFFRLKAGNDLRHSRPSIWL